MGETLRSRTTLMNAEISGNRREPEFSGTTSERHVVFDRKSSVRYPYMRLALVAIPFVASTLLRAQAPDPDRKSELEQQQSAKEARAAARDIERQRQQDLKEEKQTAAPSKRDKAEEFRVENAGTGSGKSHTSGKRQGEKLEGGKRTRRTGNAKRNHK